MNDFIADDEEVEAEFEQVNKTQHKKKRRRLEQIKALDVQIESTLVLREAKSPRVTKIQKRGDFLDLGDEVQPGVFAVLNPLTVKGRSANRLDLAKWLVSPENPLTARVVMNRIWQQYFGLSNAQNIRNCAFQTV